MNPAPDSLEALFETPGAPVASGADAQEGPQGPTTLDALIRADAELAGDRGGFRWYRGVDGEGVVRIFRFKRGRCVEQWHQLLQSQGLRSVAGPFRTQIRAHGVLAPGSLHK